ncbi:MAG: glycosyltransferase family 4 protein [Anaerolineae bacterium]|nr:MAG: glycosyltransferase family 4 protein [Anaerolineae bacterium]
MRILFVSNWFPYPPDNGTRQRNYNLIKQLSGKHEISLVSFYRREPKPNGARIDHLRGYCSQVTIAPRLRYSGHTYRSLYELLNRRPPWITLSWNGEIAEMVVQNLSDFSPDLVLISEVLNLPLLDQIHLNVPIVLEQFEVGVIWQRVNKSRGVSKKRRIGAQAILKSYLQQRLQQVDGVTVPNDEERKIYLSIMQQEKNLEVVPNGVDIELFQFNDTLMKSNVLVYSGSVMFKANLEAVLYFLKEVLPTIQKVNPRVTLRVTGHVDQAAQKMMADFNSIELTGYLQDVQQAISSAEVCVIPLLTGSGTRLKALEAMALGVPVVTTTLGVRGIDVEDGKHVLIADSPDEFAAAVLMVMEDRKLCSNLAANARKLVEDKYSWDRIGLKLNDFCERIVVN